MRGLHYIEADLEVDWVSVAFDWDAWAAWLGVWS